LGHKDFYNMTSIAHTFRAIKLSAGSEDMVASIKEQSSTMEEMASTAEELRSSAENLNQERNKF